MSLREARLDGAASDPKPRPLAEAIDDCARALREEAPAFTRRNLLFAVRRALGAQGTQASPLTEPDFDVALRRRLARSPLPGLLPARCRWQSRRLPREWDAYFPAAVVLVDRPAILDLFVASGVIARSRLAVVCVDGTPSTVIAWLRRGFRAGRRAPVVYLHDAATVIYPFMVEPLSTLVRYRGDGPLAYRDLGLPPLGATVDLFDAATELGDTPILDLEALPPAALVRYAARSALRLIPGDPNMAPLRPGARP
jgi:hypothetical protein